MTRQEKIELIRAAMRGEILEAMRPWECWTQDKSDPETYHCSGARATWDQLTERMRQLEGRRRFIVLRYNGQPLPGDITISLQTATPNGSELFGNTETIG